MTISVRVNAQDDEIIRQYAAFNNISISELFRQSVLRRIEDEYDLKAYNEAKAEFDADPKTISHEELMKRYGLA